MNSMYGTRGFTYQLACFDGDGREAWVEEWDNLIPTAGLDFLAQVPFGGASPISNFYVGLFDKNYIPQDSAASADLPLVIGEFVGYEEAARPQWARQYNSGTHSNASGPAVFTVSPGVTRTLYGGFVCSAEAKGGNSGLVVSVGRFDNPREVYPDQRLELTVSIAFVAVSAT